MLTIVKFEKLHLPDEDYLPRIKYYDSMSNIMFVQLKLCNENKIRLTIDIKPKNIENERQQCSNKMYKLMRTDIDMNQLCSCRSRCCYEIFTLCNLRTLDDDPETLCYTNSVNTLKIAMENANIPMLTIEWLSRFDASSLMHEYIVEYFIHEKRLDWRKNKTNHNYTEIRDTLHAKYAWIKNGETFDDVAVAELSLQLGKSFIDMFEVTQHALEELNSMLVDHEFPDGIGLK